MGTDQAHSQQVNIVIDKSKRYGPFRESNPGYDGHNVMFYL